MIAVLLLLAAAPAPITGNWMTAEGKAAVEIAPCGPAFCGHIARVLKPRPGGPAMDIRNPDPRLRTRPMAGLLILTGLHPEGNRWGGRIYDPETGRTYRAELTRAGEALTVKGCLGPLCRAQHWTALPR